MGELSNNLKKELVKLRVSKGMTVGELEDAKRRALNLFDKWNDCTGAVQKGTSIYYEMQGCIEDAVECGAQAACNVYKKLESEE
jgi:hypothetical protein